MWDDMAPQTIQNYRHHTRILSMTMNADIANEDERWRERDRVHIAEYVDEIIDLLHAMGSKSFHEDDYRLYGKALSLSYRIRSCAYITKCR